MLDALFARRNRHACLSLERNDFLHHSLYRHCLYLATNGLHSGRAVCKAGSVASIIFPSDHLIACPLWRNAMIDEERVEYSVIKQILWFSRSADVVTET